MTGKGRPSTGAQLRAALAEVDRLQAEVVRLQARLDVLETSAQAALQTTLPGRPRRRGLASLIDTG